MNNPNPYDLALPVYKTVDGAQVPLSDQEVTDTLAEWTANMAAQLSAPAPPAPATVPKMQIALFPLNGLPPGWTVYKGLVAPSAQLQYAQFTG